MGVLQARIMEWVAMPSSRESSRPRDPTHISYICLHWQAGSLPLVLSGSLSLVVAGGKNEVFFKKSKMRPFPKNLTEKVHVQWQ